MIFKFQILHGWTDAQANFDQIQSAFGVPVFDSAPSNPVPGQMYFDSTKDAASTAALGYWGPTRGWTYV